MYCPQGPRARAKTQVAQSTSALNLEPLPTRLLVPTVRTYLSQMCPNSVLGGHCPAEFSFNFLKHTYLELF